MFLSKIVFKVAAATGLALVMGLPARAEPHGAEITAAVAPQSPLAAAPPITPQTVAQTAAQTVPLPAAAKPTPRRRPAITLLAKADLTRQTLTVTDNGKTVATWLISSGVEDHATPRGVFQPEWTAKMWYSHTYDNAPMPNAVFFKDGAAIHATQSIGALGRAASHGCVRLAPAHAERFYNLVQKHGLAHTRISVTGTPPYRRPMLANRNSHGLRATTGAATRRVGGGIFAQWGGGVFASSNPFAARMPAPLPLSAVRYR